MSADDQTPYPRVAGTAARMVARGAVDRALLICGTGLGVADRGEQGARRAGGHAHDSYSVERSVLSNNAQVLTMGARVIGIELAKKLADEWLNHRFDESSASAPKVAAICSDEEK